MEFEIFLHEKMRSLGAATYKKFLCNELIHHWRELVGEDIFAKVKPVKIEHGILFVDVRSSAFKDQLKFLAEEILDAINKPFAQKEPLVKEIRIAQGFQIADMPPEKNPPPAQVEKPKLAPEEIILTEEEVKRCEEKAKKISDEKLRQTVLLTLLSQAKSQKFKLANGWHKCLNCDSLCAAEEIFCDVCKIKERDSMTEELFKIFYDEPWLKAWEARKILLEQMPHMAKECSMAAVESARTTLIQRVASRVRFGDEKSPDALRLVMLAKRLPEEKLTPVIIKRTLSELQFNLSDGGKFPRQR